jgi:hypothetical protein
VFSPPLYPLHYRNHLSLPLPEDVLATNAAEYSLFRQDSWQWGALHEGRLTTARAAACMGFYEQESARLLKVPRSLSGHSKVKTGIRYFVATSEVAIENDTLRAL